MGLNELLVNNLRISTPSEPKPFPVSFGPQNDPTCSTLRVAGHTTGARADPGRAHNYSARLIRALDEMFLYALGDPGSSLNIRYANANRLEVLAHFIEDWLRGTRI